MWRSRIFWRLFGAWAVLLAVTLGLLSWLLTQRIETHLLDEIRERLEVQTLLVSQIVAQQSPDDRQHAVARLATETGARITLIAVDGTVLADSMERPEQMTKHHDRPEVQQAQSSGIGFATRYSGTVHEAMMYVARRSEHGSARYVRLAVSLTAIDAEVQWLRRLTWTATGLMLLFALLVSLVIARRLSTPLRELASAASSMAQGEYGKRVWISTSDEVGQLAAAFNEMSQACAAQIAQLEHDRQQLRAIFGSMVDGVIVLDAEQNIQFLNDAACRLPGVALETSLNRKIWEVLRHPQLGEALQKVLSMTEPHHCELEWYAGEHKVHAVHGVRLPGEPVRGAVLVFHDITPLRKLERLRQEFVANVSHELKTPLAAIQATVETLLDGAIADPEHNVRFLERVRENAERLHRLVQDLLTLGRVESGEEEVELRPVAIETVVDACISRQSDRARAKNLQVIRKPSADAVIAVADEEALAEILDNLVDNAITYTAGGGSITLRWFADADTAVVQVADSGVGIPDKDLPRIFERFYRVDKARSRELGGTGLGLSIVKHLVQRLGGSVSAASRLGRGSTFTVRLPRAPG